MLIKSALFFFVVFFFFFLKPSQIVTDFFFFFFFLRLVLSCCACAYRAPSSSSSLLGTTQQQTRQLNSTLIYDRRLPLHVIPPYRPRPQRASLLSLTIWISKEILEGELISINQSTVPRVRISSFFFFKSPLSCVAIDTREEERKNVKLCEAFFIFLVFPRFKFRSSSSGVGTDAHTRHLIQRTRQRHRH